MALHFTLFLLNNHALKFYFLLKLLHYILSGSYHVVNYVDQYLRFSKDKLLLGFKMYECSFFLINNSEIFIRTELQIVHKACTMKQEKYECSLFEV